MAVINLKYSLHKCHFFQPKKSCKSLAVFGVLVTIFVFIVSQGLWAGAGSASATPAAKPEQPVSGAKTTPVEILNINNIDGVYNKPNQPSTFKIDRPHRIATIINYHWNNARGQAPGTIGLKDQSGKTYGPWQARGNPGQGGVPNAYWEVTPNTVIPAGTYTVLDSDPATWAQNNGSGGRGFSLIKGTPEFSDHGVQKTILGKPEQKIPTYTGTYEVNVATDNGKKYATRIGVRDMGGGMVEITGYYQSVLIRLVGDTKGDAAKEGAAYSFKVDLGSLFNGSAQVVIAQNSNNYELTGRGTGTYNSSGYSGRGSGQVAGRRISTTLPDFANVGSAGVGSVGNIPAPATITQAVVGVTVPGLVSVIMGILLGLGGGGGGASPVGSQFPRGAGGPVFPQGGGELPGFGTILATPGGQDRGMAGPSLLDADRPPDGTILATPGSPEMGKAGPSLLDADRPPDGTILATPGSPEMGKAGSSLLGADMPPHGTILVTPDSPGMGKAGPSLQGSDMPPGGTILVTPDSPEMGRPGKSLPDGGTVVKPGAVSPPSGTILVSPGLADDEMVRAGKLIIDRVPGKSGGVAPHEAGGFAVEKPGAAVPPDGTILVTPGSAATDIGRPGAVPPGGGAPASSETVLPPEGRALHGPAKDSHPGASGPEAGATQGQPAITGRPAVTSADEQSLAVKGGQGPGVRPEAQVSGQQQAPVGDGAIDPDNVRSPFSGGPVKITHTVSTADGHPGMTAVIPDSSCPASDPYKTLQNYDPGRPPVTSADKGSLPISFGNEGGTTAGGKEVPASGGGGSSPAPPEGSSPAASGTHGADGNAAAHSAGVVDADRPINSTGTPAGSQTEGDWPETAVNEDTLTTGAVQGTEAAPPAVDTGQGQVPSGPQDGQTMSLHGSADGRDYNLKYDAKSGQWINTETGNYFDPDRFEGWQKDLAADSQFSAQEMDKMANRQTAFDKHLDNVVSQQKENMDTLKTIQQVQKAARDHDILAGPEGVGDVQGKLDKIAEDMAGGKPVDQQMLDKIKRIVKDRITGKTADYSAIDEAERHSSTTNLVRETIEKSAKEVVTGVNEDGSISWKGMGARIATGIVTGGVSEAGFTVADAMIKVKEGIDRGESGLASTGKAIAGVIFDELGGRAVSGVADRAVGAAIHQFPNLNKTVAETVTELSEAAGKLKQKLGTLAGEAGERISGAADDTLKQAQREYDTYINRVSENISNFENKVISGRTLHEHDVTRLLRDPASMRQLKDAPQEVRAAFNEALESRIYKPTDDAVLGELRKVYGDSVKLKTIRTPKAGGGGPEPWDINTDRDVFAVRKVAGPDGKEVLKEIPRQDWESLYKTEFAKNTRGLNANGNFNIEGAKARFPDAKWDKMKLEDQIDEWARRHNQTPTDVYHPEAARDFSTQSTTMLGGQSPERAAAGMAKAGEGTLLDPSGMANMEKFKVREYWEKRNITDKTEALEQLSKMGKITEELTDGYRRQGYTVQDLPANMKDALEIVRDRSLSPAERAAGLQKLGFSGGPEELADKLSGRIEGLKMAGQRPEVRTGAPFSHVIEEQLNNQQGEIK